MERLNDFQKRLESRLHQLLTESGRSFDKREVMEAEVPAFSKEPFWFLKLQSQDLEIWIYDNELSYSSQNGGGGLELEAFNSEEELTSELVRRIREVL